MAKKKPSSKKRDTRESYDSLGSKLPRTLLFLCVVIIAILAYQVWSLSEQKSALQPAYDTLTQGITGEQFTYNGRTLVVHDTPPITATIYTSSSCATCEDDVTSLRTKVANALPTAQITIEKLDHDALSARDIHYIPAVTFDAPITETAFYADGVEYFAEIADETYILDSGALGFEPQMYITTPLGTEGFPSPSADAASTGTTTATPVEIHAFLSTDCAQCATMHDVLSLVAQRNPGAEIIYHFASTREEAEHSATTALACATSLGKGASYRTHLYARQSLWKAATDKDAAFASYAAAWGIPSADFTTCLSQEATQDAVAEQNALFARYGINAVPTLFIGDDATPLTGVQTVATIEAALK